VDLSAWIMFSIASLFILGIPGPIALLAMARASTGGLVGAVPLAFGAALGDGIALLLSFAGIGAILQSSQPAFLVVRILGACYLVSVGVRMLVGSEKATSNMSPASHDGSFRQGFLLAAMHPASLVFFVAYVPLFIAPDDPVLPQFGAMAATFVVMGLLSVLSWAAIAALGQHALARHGMSDRVRLVAGGAVTIFGGAALADAVSASHDAQSSQAQVAAFFEYRSISS
jgi:threonine/homoserine/homoserine lactone efflux protein